MLPLSSLAISFWMILNIRYRVEEKQGENTEWLKLQIEKSIINGFQP